jgi:hypothetical protein
MDCVKKYTCIYNKGRVKNVSVQASALRPVRHVVITLHKALHISASAAAMTYLVAMMIDLI